MADLSADRVRDLATQLKGSAASPVTVNIIADALLEAAGPPPEAPAAPPPAPTPAPTP